MAIDYVYIVNVMAHYVRTSPPELCRAESLRFEPRSDHHLLSVHFTSYYTTLLSYAVYYISLQIIEDGKHKVKTTCHFCCPNIKIIKNMLNPVVYHTLL